MSRHKTSEVLIFLIILSVAIFFRFYALDQTPPGLYPDEAMNGSNALVANDTGDYKIFYPENTGREGLFINLQALSIKYFGIHPWALRGVSAVIGVLTVIGLYLLTRTLFDRHIATLSSFLMAISFWHVNFSRIGFRAIMLPFILVWAFYFLWKGLHNSRLLDFMWAGVFFGMGFYTYTSYRIAPLIVLIVFLNYWWFLRKDFLHKKYEHARNRLWAGFATVFLVTFFVALPIGLYFYMQPDNFMQRGGLSVFAQTEPIKSFIVSTVQTLGMFNFAGDCNQRHNISCAPMLPWPIGILFLIGFIKELWHWFERKHGHLSTVHTFLFAWFFIMLLPGILSVEAPHALRTIGAVPVVMIFAGRGLWWVFKALGAWHEISYPHLHPHGHSKTKLAIWTLAIYLAAVGVYEFHRYFNVWGKNPATAGAFNQNYVEIARKINSLPLSVKKYVIVRAPAIIAYDLPVSAQTVIFLTDTVTAEKQRAKNLQYITPDQVARYRFLSRDAVFELR